MSIEVKRKKEKSEPVCTIELPGVLTARQVLEWLQDKAPVNLDLPPLFAAAYSRLLFVNVTVDGRPLTQENFAEMLDNVPSNLIYAICEESEELLKDAMNKKK